MSGLLVTGGTGFIGSHVADALITPSGASRRSSTWRRTRPAREGRPPVVALHWNPRTGALSRLTDRGDPFLRQLIALLVDADSAATLDRILADALASLVAPRTAADR